jgi:segregation and condensation protein A
MIEFDEKEENIPLGLDKGIANEEIESRDKMGQEQVYDLFTSQKPDWQALIYDLINSEQLDPWDINIALLANRYLDRIRQLEEESFFVSSKMLLACSLLLRIKSEILLNEHIKSLDDILFGRKEQKKYEYERIIIDENEIPELLPKTPMARLRKVTLQELMNALSQAMNTETRRIKKEINQRKAFMDAQIVMPRKTVNIKERIRKIYARVLSWFSRKQERMSFTELAGADRDERIASFLPILHLDNQSRVWLEQEAYFEEIWIWLKSVYDKTRDKELKDGLREDMKEIEKGISNEQLRRIEKINKDFENPLANFFDIIEKD